MRNDLIRNIKYHYKDKGPNYEIDMHIDLKRFIKQYNNAQFKLDSMIMTSMLPYMPMQTGTFIKVTRAMSAAIAGSGKVVAAAPPFGRYLYHGMTMVDEGTGSPFARKGAKKVLVSQYSGKTNAKECLEFSEATNPSVTAEWFEVAKRLHGASWVETAKRIAGGGRNGR